MSWLIKVGEVGGVKRIGSKSFERGINADVTTSTNCSVTSNPCHTIVQLSCYPNAVKTTLDKAGSNPACLTEKVWQNVLASLVGV
jgi:hypothetical protein